MSWFRSTSGGVLLFFLLCFLVFFFGVCVCFLVVFRCVCFFSFLKMVFKRPGPRDVWLGGSQIIK